MSELKTIIDQIRLSKNLLNTQILKQEGHDPNSVMQLVKIESSLVHLESMFSKSEQTEIVNTRQSPKAMIAERHFNILCEAMAEIKATVDGKSTQPIKDIVSGCLDEIEMLEVCKQDKPKGGSDE